MDPQPPALVIFGGPSLHPVQVGDTHREVVAGAGFVTALAARAQGAPTGLVARVPWDLPPAIAAAFGPHGLDPGGLSPSPGELPGFHIAYDGDEAADYVAFSPGVEAGTTAADLPQRWLSVPRVHVAPIGGETARQQAIVDGLRARGFAGRISAGTYPRAVAAEPEAVRALASRCDRFFCNAAEARALWGEAGPPAGLAVVITRGPEGLEVHEGGHVARHAAPPAHVVDPTGAGDAIVGGWLAGEVLGLPPAETALHAAARVLSGWGAAAFLETAPPPLPPAPPAAAPALGLVRVDPDRVAAVGQQLATVAAAASLSFTGFPFPEAGAPRADEVLALATLHQYGFWTADDQRWLGPMFATAGGRQFKGSDFVWQAFTRAAADDPTVIDPARLAAEPLLFDRICRDDDGACPVPDAGSHRLLQQAWGAALLTEGGWSAVLARARAAEQPVRTLLDQLALLPGYREDPLAKKATLHALILLARPEGFLPDGDRAALGPIVDYHLMRGCLRTGCVQILDPELRAALAERRWISGPQEAAVRLACRDALVQLSAASGLGVAPIDGFFFANGRRTCLETAPPRCEHCDLADPCARAGELFQPVYRTTAY